MQEPIKRGDRARIIRGMAQHKSPNVGKVVTVGSEVGVGHTRYGKIFHCEGEGVCQMDDSGAFIVKGWAHVPASWLEKIEPDEAPPALVEEKNALKA